MLTIAEKNTQNRQANHLRNRFNSSSLDAKHVWTMDLNYLQGSWLLTVQDQTTRQIIIHRFFSGRNNHFTSKDIIATLDECIPNRQRPRIIHTDSKHQFLSAEYAHFLQGQGIQQSIANGRSKEKLFRHHN